MDVDTALDQLRGPAWRADVDRRRRGHRSR
jgi:hypothetical protein